MRFSLITFFSIFCAAFADQPKIQPPRFSPHAMDVESIQQTISSSSLSPLLSSINSFQIAESSSIASFQTSNEDVYQACVWDAGSSIGWFDLRSLAGTIYRPESSPLVKPYKLTFCSRITDQSDCEDRLGSFCYYADGSHFTHLLATWKTNSQPIVWAYDTTLKVLTLTFRNGDECSSFIEMTCDPGRTEDEGSLIKVIRSGSDYRSYFTSRHACPLSTPFPFGTKDPQRLSIGWIIIAAVIILLTLYVLIGCLYKRLLVGAKGSESCPNSDFWRLFFGYAWKGLRVSCYRICCCRKPPGSYDPIV